MIKCFDCKKPLIKRKNGPFYCPNCKTHYQITPVTYDYCDDCKGSLIECDNDLLFCPNCKIYSPSKTFSEKEADSLEEYAFNYTPPGKVDYE
jgi:uncharacterized Zn finger protein (UPF0148 family)